MERETERQTELRDAHSERQRTETRERQTEGRETEGETKRQRGDRGRERRERHRERRGERESECSPFCCASVWEAREPFVGQGGRAG